MANLTIGNSMSQLSGLTSQQFVKVRKLTSYIHTTGKKVRIKTRSGIKYIPERKTKYLMDKTGAFPTGLLYIVEGFMLKYLRGSEVIDNRVMPERNSSFPKLLPLPFPAYPEQLEAADASAKHHRGIVVATTGVGKSRMAIEILNTLQVKTLVTVPSLALKSQLTATLREAFGNEAVGPLKNGKAVRMITVENVDALDIKHKPEGVQCLLIDEFHHAGSATYRKLNAKAWSDIYYRIGLTATPHRSQDEERLLLESVLSQCIYRVPYEKAVAKGYIVPMEVYYYEVNS